MAKGPSRIGALLIAPLILAVGCARKPDVAPAKWGNHAILVGPKACDLSFTQVAEIGTDNVIWWGSVDDKELWIEFDEEIFKKMVPGQVRKYRVDCRGKDPSSCFSHTVLESAKHNIEYKYWQILVDPDPTKPRDECDGRIIIKP